MSQEHRISYQTSNTYSSLNNLSEKTKTMWLVFHGMGYLSRYFLKYFKGLDPVENFIVAPQAPSKYYLNDSYKHVGACWLTKEDTPMEKENCLQYIDAVWKAVQPKQKVRLIFIGYSQGVSIVTRWMARNQIDCDTLLLHSGGIPTELRSADFNYMKDKTNVLYHYGTADPYITTQRLEEEVSKAQALFKNRVQFVAFEGKHEVNTEFLRNL